ncbi:Leucine-rich repeat (LRR) family protein [Raphanus sativus]|uniref:LRR receptor-like serine/threonine-protein kinase GHR1 n=1 Tax=Raphanus sativus TaxID=3726 RepID=A0A9W3DI55_RAPSA|nr:LRR receptor-like serine/threonine-protein kinase GHR1 [Raphanus sativus]KAJ4899622.1 Leucine-rich repeat (LRR) family protein [Raphanus sativus]
METASPLVRLCLEEACKSRDAVDRWRLQRRSLERLPPHLADALLRQLLLRRLLFPSLLEVFKHSVEKIDLRGESSVNGEWMAYIGGFVNLYSLNLSDCPRINNSTIWPITGLTCLKELDLSRCSKVTDAGMKHLQSVVNLEKLWISQTGVKEAGISLLASLKKLSLLDLGGLPVTDHNLSSLQALTKLEYLDIWGSNVTNQGAVSILEFPNLSFLNLSWTSVTQAPNIPHLECLLMNKCTVVSISNPHSSSVLASLKKLVLSGATFSAETEVFSFTSKSSITHLDVSKTFIQDFSFLETMTKLEHLDLSSTAFGDDSVEFVLCVGDTLRNLNVSYTKITYAGVELLSGHVPRLETLSLSQTSIDDLSILCISNRMPCIKALDLSRTSIRGFIQQQSPEEEEEAKPSLAALKSLTALTTLSLEHPHLSDIALSPLSSLTGLTHLSLKSNSLTDSTLHHLSSLPNLVSLGFQDAVLTNLGLEKFKPPSSLRTLDLKGCWLLTEAAVTGLCKKHPHIKVMHEFALESSSLDQNKTLPRSSPPPQSLAKVGRRKNNQSPETSAAVSRSFIDQRMKYNREDLFALQDSPLSRLLPQEGEFVSVPEILADFV